MLRSMGKVYQIDVVSLSKDLLEECASLIAELTLYQQYDFTCDKALSALLSAMKDSRCELRVARVDGKTAGIAWFVAEGGFARSGYLKLIAVADEFQCSGVGRRLIEDLESRHLHPNGIFILASSTNAHAREFYEKLGYAKVGEIPDFVKPGLNEVIYFKK